jgi:hypothetical protein
VAKFLLIDNDFRDGLIRQMRKRVDELEERFGVGLSHAEPPKAYIYHLERAPVIELPEIHIFQDDNGDRWQVVAWSKEEAQAYIEAQAFITKPTTWKGSSTAYPGLHLMRETGSDDGF